ncbi:Histidine kinase-, DNA gyrase B-, and HSP90-like ATPase [Hymenobacter daecheongensis DSM 21074]|uniref:histidine kinase n=1 Tax=Hymenobacter daecheongensis DSM 21074 TaxID=1121955 RepID=A0A1M6C785_9BACT|nr:HAMP domain-containing sensor histidine kinase [Hymenobacter daecheongensis]SHI56641.1 Histidine kinase-, DNA gyrase B-, and HSP90-like ATPase [Hymenobacter daecheongensis DSM 21074]
MKSFRLSPLLLLIGAALCFLGAYVSSQYGQAADTLLRTDVARLQSLVLEAETTAEREAAEVADRLRQGQISFSSLIGRTTYPCFIFRGEQLWYWSDHTMRPDAENVGQNFEEKLVDMKFGRFLALRQTAGPYVILTYVPLEKRYGISNRYLKEGEETALFRGLNVGLVVNPTGGRALPKIYSEGGRYLFSIENLQTNSAAGKYLSLALLLLGFGLYLFAWLKLARDFLALGEIVAAAATVVVPLAAFRAVLLYLGLPFSVIEIPLFDPRVYAASWLAPSLGDLLINAFLLLLTAYYGLVLFRRYGLVRWGRQVHGLAARALFGGVVVLLFLGLLELLFQFYSNSFNNSQLVLDITQSIQISGFKLLLGFAIVLHTGGYLVGFYILSQLFTTIVRPGTKRLGVLLLGSSAIVFLPTGLWLDQMDLVLLGITLLFFFVVRLTGLKQLAAVVPYQIYLFIFLMLGVSSAVGALALYEHFDHQLVLNKQNIAANLLLDNDLQGEYLLAGRTRELAADPLIRSMLASPFANRDMVRQKIVKYYLRDYFDKYEIVVSLFDPNGKAADGGERAPSLYQVRRQLLRKATPTDQPNLYLVRGSNSFSTRRYVAFVRVPSAAGRGANTVLLELSLKKLTAYSVVPELLVDQKFFQPNIGPELSYAGYENGRLMYNEGDFDYSNNLSAQELRDPKLYTAGLSVNDFHHLAVRGPQGRTVVVTTATYSFSNWLSNFSFLFLLHTFFWLLCIGLYMLGRGRYVEAFQTNFSTKIQLFLNFGILVPLVVVSVATASQVTSSYKSDLRRTYERRGKAVQENLLRNTGLLADSASRAPLIDLAENVAGLTETDLNLYDAHGQLLVSSQPLIFESGLLSPLMNPQAVASLAERGQPRVLLTEQAGTLSFNALYLPLHTLTGQGQAGAVTGYVGIPFFDSEKELDNKLIELISTILNIFTVMFILFLVLTFVASRLLTNPLKVITEKLKHTTLTGQNEMLAYESSDEIGLLVREYNAMLLKLEESKQELATQEKEAAWREMARQVAHEIKNPLTPMKLSLQFLQKAIAEQRPNVEELIGKISQTLITQVDVLNDIATSFSNFTNLPAMRPERLDVVAILHRCVALHQGDAHGGTIQLHEPAEAQAGHYLVFADENLLVRTFNNLLINALQSVPAGRTPHVVAAVTRQENDQVRICIQDNGAGIPADVRDKIFVPNFTTKESGSGIGLAVARRGIESAGGRIWFETEEGVGTRFCIELPLAPA